MKTLIFILSILFFLSPPLFARDFTQGGIYFEQAMSFKGQGNFVEAERNLKKALDIEPANPNYHFELANIYAMKFDHYSTKKTNASKSVALSAAARALEQTLMLNPDSIEASFNVGVVYKKQGKYELARERFRQVLEIYPNLPNAYLQIAATYEEQGFFEEARDAYLQAQTLDFGNSGIRSSLEELKLQKERDRERMDAEYMQERYFRRRGIELVPGSKSEQYHLENNQAAANHLGPIGAIPYLSFWLADQFMQAPAEQI